MGIDEVMSDKAVLEQFGSRLGRRRVELDFTQAALAKEAGVSKRTVERLEAGASVQTATLIRVLRVLGGLELLDAVIPEPGPRPLELLKMRGKERKRASSKRPTDPLAAGWSWGDET